MRRERMEKIGWIECTEMIGYLRFVGKKRKERENGGYNTGRLLLAYIIIFCFVKKKNNTILSIVKSLFFYIYVFLGVMFFK
eukprot:UN04134